MTTRKTLLLVLMGGLAAAPAALAQNALDRNLQRGSGGINPTRPSFGQELAFRNAVVTGNAPGGMSFRGNVGYRAPGEFFGSLGSNENFNFRRDSVYSGLGGLGIRGTDALQYQFAMTTGNAPPRATNRTGAAWGGLGSELGGLTVNRTGTGTTGGQVTGETGGALANTTPYTGARSFTPGAQSGDFIRGGDLLPMRSPSAYLTNRSLEPTLLGTGQDAEGRTLGITASSLRGIAVSPLNYRGQQSETQAEQDGQAERPASPLAAPSTAVDQRIDARLNTQADTRADLTPTPPTPYDQLLARMQVRTPANPQLPGQAAGQGQAGAEGPDNRTNFQRRMDELRSQLRDPQQPAPGSTPAPAAPTAPPAPGAPLPPGAPPGAGQAPNTLPPAPGTAGGFRPETIDMLREGGGGPLTDLAPAAPEGFDAYSNAMRAGQELLAAGRYFDAEARFTTALGAKPGDPLAAAGRVNAELGAGMFLSAALNLRTLLTQNPEIVGIRYAAGLLPAPERLPAIQERLRGLLDEHEGKDPEIGLLIAYLGYQSGNAAAVRTGLAAMNTAPEGDSLRRLSALLQEVWTKPAANPAAAPATPPGAKPNPPVAPAAPAPAPPPAANK